MPRGSEKKQPTQAQLDYLSKMVSSSASKRRMMGVLGIGNPVLDRWLTLIPSTAPAPLPEAPRAERYELPPASLEGPIPLPSICGPELLFGIVSDTHLCSTKERLDVLNTAYDEFASVGIHDVFLAGNLSDGESKLNRFELRATGFDAQLQYVIDHYPVRPGITTHYIDADDHEGWWRQREGIIFGQHLTQSGNRPDLHYLGYLEADVALSPRSFMRIFHPGGGVPYAHSYVPQKIIESYGSGEKPDILVIGHHHKLLFGIDRNVYWLMAGCTQDQTHHSRKKKIAHHIGYTIMRVQLDKQGVVSSVGVTIRRFYDRPYYTRLQELPHAPMEVKSQ